MPSKSHAQLRSEMAARKWVANMVHRIGSGSVPVRSVNSVIREASELFPVPITVLKHHISLCVEEGEAQIVKGVLRRKKK